MEYKTKYESIVLIGKIASGKGTQAKAILDHFGGTLFSIGNKVRETAELDTTFGRKIKETYEAGWLIPDWIASYWMTHALLAQHIDDRIVFEAVARKESEAVQFTELHQWLDREFIVINLEIPDELAYERSTQRHRDVVDSEESIKTRLEEYRLHTTKALAVFRSYNRVVDIDATQDQETVEKEIFKCLQA